MGEARRQSRHCLGNERCLPLVFSPLRVLITQRSVHPLVSEGCAQQSLGLQEERVLPWG